jgi:hypothetical protein
MYEREAVTAYRSMKLEFAPSLEPLRPELAALLALWRSSQPQPDALPPRSAFTPLSLKPFLPHIFIVEHELQSGRYRYRLIGTEITAVYQRDSTGRYFDEIYTPEDAAAFIRGYDWVRVNRKPCRFHGTLFFVGRDYMQMDALLLPVTVPEGQNPQFIAAIYFSPMET